MSEDDYYAAVKALGLIATQFRETFFTVRNEPFSVPLARELSPEARRETIEWLKRMLAANA